MYQTNPSREILDQREEEASLDGAKPSFHCIRFALATCMPCPHKKRERVGDRDREGDGVVPTNNTVLPWPWAPTNHIRIACVLQRNNQGGETVWL